MAKYRKRPVEIEAHQISPDSEIPKNGLDMNSVTADRSARQSATDHATRPERIEAVTRDLWADLDYYTTERGER